MEELTERDLERYNRQIMLKEINEEGQRRLKSTTVTVLGIGGLGSPVSIYLAAAGVGRLRLIDHDTVEFSNLNRQILHWENDVDRKKLQSAEGKLTSLNKDITIEGSDKTINNDTIDELLKGTDLVVDALDNFNTRFLVNEYCVNNGIPFVHAAVYGLEGRLTTILPNKGPCLRCQFPESPTEKETFPIFGATAGVIASLEVIEVVKLICDIGTPVVNRLLIFDGKALQFHTAEIKQDPDCPVCGT